MCGPYGFGLVTRFEITVLVWINDFALGFIGLSAGGHFHISEMASSVGPALILLSACI